MSDAPIYPLRFGGGLFLVAMGGAALLAVAIDYSQANLFLLGGVAVGALAVAASGRYVIARFGRPRRVQLLLLWAVILLEIAAFYYVTTSAVLRGWGPKQVELVLLAIVGAHFVLMRWSFGPWISRLGLAILVWLAIAALTGLPETIAVAGTGALNALCGMVMASPLLGARRPATAA